MQLDEVNRLDTTCCIKPASSLWRFWMYMRNNGIGKVRSFSIFQENRLTQIHVRSDTCTYSVKLFCNAINFVIGPPGRS